MFKILSLLRDLNTMRSIQWHVQDSDYYDEGEIVVRIPVTTEDRKFINDMQAMFAPVED